MSDEPKREQLVDVDEIVGEPPAGDAFLDDFVSNDQSAVPTGSNGPEPTDGSDEESEDHS
jgi:hypothetical protein